MPDKTTILIRTSPNDIGSIDQVPPDYYPTSVVIHRSDFDEIFYDPVSSNDGSRLFCMFDQMFWKGKESQYRDPYTTGRYCVGLSGLVSPMVIRNSGRRSGLGSTEYFKGYDGFTFAFNKFSCSPFEEYVYSPGNFYKYIIFDMFGLKIFSKVILFEPLKDHLSVKFAPFQLPPIYNEHFLKVFNIDLERDGDDWFKICFWGRTVKGGNIEFIVDIHTHQRCIVSSSSFRPRFILLANPT
jgi:hypothetical protein